MSWLDSDKLEKLADALGGGDENQSLEEDSVTYGADTAEVEVDDDTGADDDSSNDGEQSDVQDDAEESAPVEPEQGKPEDADLSKRAQKRIQKLLSSRNDATRRAKELEARLAELESKATQVTDDTSTDEESDEDFLKRIYGDEDEGPSDPRYAELQRSHELQQSQLNEILVERERDVLRQDISTAEEAHPDVPNLKAILINAVMKDGSVDVLDFAEQYANMVYDIRGSGKTETSEAGTADSGPRAVPRPAAKGTKPSSGMRQTNQAPVRDWKTAHQSFMDAIKD
jgi:hypothetical protein